RRDRGEERAEHAAQMAEPGVPLLERDGVFGRELAHLLGAARRVLVHLQVAPVRVGDEVIVLRIDLEAEALELELAQDRRRHDADHVGQGGHLEIGAPGRLGDRSAADLGPAFEEDDAPAALGEEPGGDEAIVPAAHDDDVGVLHAALLYVRMERRLEEILGDYDDAAPLAEAWTIPSSWYTDTRVAELERRTVFSRSWQPVGRAAEVAKPGQYLTAEVAGEPV